MSVDLNTFRNALRKWASGVTIVSARVSESQLHGMTVSAFSSVSAEPPLVMVCCNRESDTTSFVRSSGKFTVNLLSDSQQALSSRFASSKVPDRFEGIVFDSNEYGCILPEALSVLSCRVRVAYEEGSHTVFIAVVEDVHISEESKPLVYFDGAYRGLLPD